MGAHVSSSMVFSIRRFRNPTGNFYQISADLSYPGNISQTVISTALGSIFSTLPPQFNATYINTGLLDPEEIQPINRK